MKESHQLRSISLEMGPGRKESVGKLQVTTVIPGVPNSGGCYSCQALHDSVAIALMTPTQTRNCTYLVIFTDF